MATKIQLRRGTAAAWTAANPTLAAGEPGLETDTGKRKTGDGATAWNALGYDNTGAGLSGNEPQWVPGLMVPAAFHGSPWNLLIGTTSVMTSLRMFIARYIAPQAGSLKDFYIYVGATANGNAWGSVYDTGDAAGGGAGTRTRLWDSGSVAIAAANGWLKLGDPNVTVAAGQRLDVALMLDNNTATINKVTSPNPAAMGQLPFGNTPGGALPKAFGFVPAATTFVQPPATITEAGVSLATAGVSVPAPILRVG